jgi:hypothetical protein
LGKKKNVVLARTQARAQLDIKLKLARKRRIMAGFDLLGAYILAVLNALGAAILIIAGVLGGSSAITFLLSGSIFISSVFLVINASSTWTEVCRLVENLELGRDVE